MNIILPTLFRTKFKVRVLYKSGNSHEFWATKFSFSNEEYIWTPVYRANRPIIIGASDIEAVYQVGARLNPIFWIWELITGWIK